MLRERESAVLVLEDGYMQGGRAYGAVGRTVGEIVFSTGMTGYQETLTDPSYHRQIVVMTAPHVGNTGVNDEDPESTRIWVAGYVVRDPARRASNWRSRRELEDELVEHGVTGYLVPAGDHRALAGKLCELLENDALRSEMGGRGRAVIEQRFAWARVIGSCEEFYCDLLETSHESDLDNLGKPEEKPGDQQGAWNPPLRAQGD